MRRTFAALAFTPFAAFAAPLAVLSATVCAALFAAACASAPPAPATHPAPPSASFDQKMSWILRLEDQRMLRDPAPPPVPPPPVARGQKPAVVEPPPPPPDLVRLLKDDEARIRRRAALAIGRVGLRDGGPPLVAALADSDPEVRQMAAFALGLLGDKSARDPLVAALADPAIVVRASAADALGLVGDAAAADAIAKMAAQLVASGAFAQPPTEQDEERRDTSAGAVREAAYALVRLKAYPALATVVLDQSGQPITTWWPVAYALSRIEDARAYNALMALLKAEHPYTRAFALKGLGALKNRAAVAAVLPLVSSTEKVIAIEAVRALGKIGDPAAGQPLLTLIREPKTDPTLRIEAVAALGSIGGDGVVDTLLDFLADRNPLVRAAAITALASLDRVNFVTTLSALDPDPDWHVRAALATVLGTLTPDVALPRLRTMLADPDQRVIPAVLDSMTALHAPDAPQVMLEHLKADDPFVRETAAENIGRLKPPAGAASLADAYQLGQRDPEYAARAAALSALAEYGAGAATPLLTTALGDKDWVVRLRAALLLKRFDPASDADVRIRPAPTTRSPDAYEDHDLTSPPVSTAAYIDTDRGTIQIELAVLDAPLTVNTFVALAQKNFYNGVSFHRVVPDFVVQAGDPRGDGNGGPGFAIRDELNERPFLRGAVGIALDGPDTGGSQFFITHSPQPHLDAKYTVFGRVVSGMDVVDALQQGDVIRGVRIWNGNEAGN